MGTVFHLRFANNVDLEGRIKKSSMSIVMAGNGSKEDSVLHTQEYPTNLKET